MPTSSTTCRSFDAHVARGIGMAGTPSKGFRWRKSSASGGTDCVEVAFIQPEHVLVRHSKDSEGPVLRFTGAEWEAFVAGVRGGEFDR
jgi:hypothetical protein